MYKFNFMYEDDYDSFFTLPLAPAEFNTKVGSKNKTIDLIEMGEVNIVKSIGLRDFDFKILLPKDSQLCDDEADFKEPIFFLNKFREFKEKKKVVVLTIIRKLPNAESLFSGNVRVTLEDYSVAENAGEEGEFWVELSFKEYKKIELVETKPIGVSKDGKTQVMQEVKRAVKETTTAYTTKLGDSLWKIAKLQLNDGSRYKEIASLNNITNYNNLKEGTVLRLP